MYSPPTPVERFVDITVYLPDELGRWAKDNDLNLSRMLRDAVEVEREHRRQMESWRGEPAVHELLVEGPNGIYTARLHAKEVAHDGRNQWLYVAEDGDVYVYDNDAQQLYDMRVAPRDGWKYGDRDFYVAIMHALGEGAVVDIGRTP